MTFGMTLRDGGAVGRAGAFVTAPDCSAVLSDTQPSIGRRPIKGINVATGNSRDQLACDPAYRLTHIWTKHEVPGSDYTSIIGSV